MPEARLDGRYNALRSALIEARQARGLKQIELAAALGRPQSYVSNYERGERRLDIVEFVEIAHALGADPIVLLKVIAAPENI